MKKQPNLTPSLGEVRKAYSNPAVSRDDVASLNIQHQKSVEDYLYRETGKRFLVGMCSYAFSDPLDRVYSLIEPGKCILRVPGEWRTEWSLSEMVSYLRSF